MLSEAAKRELLEAAASKSLRRDFDRMSENVRTAAGRLSVDDLIDFLNACSALFGPRAAPPPHVSYPRARI